MYSICISSASLVLASTTLSSQLRIGGAEPLEHTIARPVDSGKTRVKKKKTFKGKRNHLDPCHGRCILSPAKPIGCGEKLSMSRWMSARMQLPFHRALNTSSGVEYNLSLDIPVLSTPSWHTGRVIQKPYAEKYPCGNLWNFTNLPSSTRV